MNWTAQMRAVFSLPEYCGNNTGWADWSWYIEAEAPGFFSVSFLVYPDIFPLVLSFLILDVPNMHDAQRVTSSFKYRNIDGKNPSFAILNMYLGYRLDKLSCQDFNPCCKGYITFVKMMSSMFSCVILFDSFI